MNRTGAEAVRVYYRGPARPSANMPDSQQPDARWIPTPSAAAAVLAALALICTVALAGSGAGAAPTGSPESTEQLSWPDSNTALTPRYMPGGRCIGLFNNTFPSEVADAHPGARFTAAVNDHRTG